MAANNKEQLLQTMDMIITELEGEGLLDKNFGLVIHLKIVNGPYFFANLLLQFISDTQNTILEIARLLEIVPVNFKAVDQPAIKLKGASSSFGIIGLASACARLRDGIEARSLIWCTHAKNEIQNEFTRVHARLDAIIQLEQQIILCG